MSDVEVKIYTKLNDVRYNENGSSEIVILSLKEAIGILGLRSLGYYKIQQWVLSAKYE